MRSCWNGARGWNVGPRKFEVIFDEAALKASQEELDKKLADPEVWSDPSQGERLSRERSRLLADLELIQKLDDREEEVRTLIEWAKEGESVASDLQAHLERFEEEIEAAEIQKPLGGENDAKNAIVSPNCSSNLGRIALARLVAATSQGLPINTHCPGASSICWSPSQGLAGA